MIVWGTEGSHFAGQISVQGGPQGGDGGFAEVSGKSLQFLGLVNSLAPLGAPGKLLLDPINITIQNMPDSPNVSFMSPDYIFTACMPSPALIDAAGLIMNLNSGNVVISTTTDPMLMCVADAGNILVSNAVTWMASTSLTLAAANNITVNAPLTNNTAGSALSMTRWAGSLPRRSSR